MQKILRTILGKKGFQIRRTSVINLRNTVVHPIDLAFYAQRSSSSIMLINVPVDRCRTQIWNTLERKESPFVNTIVSYQEEKAINYSSSPLKDYYDTYLPRSAAEVLRLNENEILSKVPSYGYILPWDNQNVDHVIKIREMITLYENKREGSNSGISSGHTDFGPVSGEKGEIEFKRLVRVADQIRMSGYKENPYLEDGGIRGYFLVGVGGEWCFNIRSGKHRAYALAAMGKPEIPVVIDNDLSIIIRTLDIEFWPQVQRSVFSEAEALRVANNMLRTVKGS